MSGIEVVGLIAAIIGISESIIKAYDAIKDLRGLPEAFQTVNTRLPIIQQTLQDASTWAEDIKSDDHAGALKAVLISCKEKIEKLKKIFEEIANTSKKKFNLSVYRILIAKLGKTHLVETLMKDILGDLGTLATHHIFYAAAQKQAELGATDKQIELGATQKQAEITATQKQAELLEKAREDLATVPTSLSESDLDEIPSTASQYGDNNSQYNHFGPGDMNNIEGHYFQAEGEMNFDMIPPI